MRHDVPFMRKLMGGADDAAKQEQQSEEDGQFDQAECPHLLLPVLAWDVAEVLSERLLDRHDVDVVVVELREEYALPSAAGVCGGPVPCARASTPCWRQACALPGVWCIQAKCS